MKHNLIRSVILMGASTLLAVVGLGSSCPGTGSTANFENPQLFGARPAAASLRSWRTPMFMDLKAGDGVGHRNNVTAAGAVGLFSGVGFAQASQDFLAVFNSGVDLTNYNNAATVTVQAYATRQTSFTSSTWVTSLAHLTQIDAAFATLSEDSQNPKVAVDSTGNAMAIYYGENAATKIRPLASMHTYLDNTWAVPVDISDSAEVTVGGGVLPGILDGANSASAIAVDSYNNFVAVWAQGDRAFFNEYRPNLGWRFTATPFTPWSLCLATETVQEQGIDVAFDLFGNGWGAYVVDVGGAGDFIRVVRWRGNTLANFDRSNGSGDCTTPAPAAVTASTDIQSIGTVGTVVGYPKLFMASDGSAHLFYYDNSGGNTADLMYVAASATSAAAPASFGSLSALAIFGVGSQSFMQDSAGTVIEPLVRGNQGAGAVAVITTPGVTSNLRVYKHQGDATWKNLGLADGNSGLITWADMAINAAGDIAVAFAVDELGVEHIYGNVYTSGAWQGVTQLDGTNISASLTYGTSGQTRARPSVSIDASGNAMVIYSSRDTVPIRRALGVFFR